MTDLENIQILGLTMFFGAVHHLDEFSKDKIEYKNFVTTPSFWCWTITLLLLLLWFLIALILNTQTRIFIKKEAKNRREMMSDRAPLRKYNWGRKENTESDSLESNNNDILKKREQQQQEKNSHQLSRENSNNNNSNSNTENLDKKRVRNVFV